ncbi:MAG: LLM class flavin-dependent oxidoreductase [Chloroflexi bacterium]|nr:MAG: LLM class flavin-dependent oxidoreductase [Chloroflexota bacterium]
MHSFHTVRYLQEVTLPAIREGAEKSGRNADDVQLSCAIFVVTGRNEEEMRNSAIAAKSQIAFYASTPSYAPVMQLHGWDDIQAKLSQMAREGRWNEMWQEVTDEMLETIAVVAPPDELPYKVKERYEGILSRVGYYLPYEPQDEQLSYVWQAAAKAFRE